MTHPLDGQYLISSASSYQGPIEKRSDGQTEIINGRTERFDDANCKWTSSFEILNDKEVKMVSVADPREAHIDFALIAPDGSLTREPATYEAILRYVQDGEMVQMSGEIKYGIETVFLSMQKILK